MHGGKRGVDAHDNIIYHRIVKSSLFKLLTLDQNDKRKSIIIIAAIKTVRLETEGLGIYQH